MTPAPRLLFWLGGTSSLVYLGVLLLSWEFRYGEGHAERPILAVLSLFGLAMLGYWVALHRVTTVRGSPGCGEVGHTRVIVGFALLFRLLLLGSNPIQEIDYYRYLWDGQVLAHGFNPFRSSPGEIDREGPHAAPGTELASLWTLAHRSPAVETIFSRVHHREVPTIYPPAAQMVFALAAQMTPETASLWMHLLVWKALLLGFDLGTLWLVILLLRKLRLPPSWCLAYAWCPLALKELTNSAHLDAIAVFFTTLALYCLVLLDGQANPGRRWLLGVLAGAALGLGVLGKSYPVVLVPVIGAYLLCQEGWRAAWIALVSLTVVIVGYLPFTTATGGNTPWTGLGTFLGRWEMNDFLFMLAHENLRPPQSETERWFVVVPAAWRWAWTEQLQGVLAQFGVAPIAIRPAFLLTQGLMGFLLAGLTLRWAWLVFRTPRPPELLRGCFLTLSWAWLLSSAPNPWYLLWGLPLLVFAKGKSWWLLPGLAFLYYLRFWLEYQALGDDVALMAARNWFDFGVVWVEFFLFFVALLAERWLRRPSTGSACSQRESLPPEG